MAWAGRSIWVGGLLGRSNDRWHLGRSRCDEWQRHHATAWEAESKGGGG